MVREPIPTTTLEETSYPVSLASSVFFFLCDKYALWFLDCVPLTKSKVAWASKLFSGNTTSKSFLSCGNVIAGAFFSQSDFQVP